MNDSISFHEGRVLLYPGDCLSTLDSLPENSIDACVCDPPYHLASIVKRFGAEGAAPAQEGTDGAFARASRGFMGKVWDGGDIAFRIDTWAKVLRVLKPGGYILAFSSSRTFGRMSVAIEDAGFITHPMIGWIFATGFPKATRIKAAGFEGQRYGAQSLKPALEPIYMGQKPFSEDNGTANILRWGTGAVNIDSCRIPSGLDHAAKCASVVGLASNRNGECYGDWAGERQDSYSPLGRWPANVITDGSPEVIAEFPERVVNTPSVQRSERHSNHIYGTFKGGRTCHSFDNEGSAARFFYAAKADTDDRLNSRHPTVKPLDLMRYLVRLVTPKNGVVLDPFSGTGTTGHATLVEGMRAILCEREEEYVEDITRRMSLVYSGSNERSRKLAKLETVDGLPLFGGGAS